MKKIKNKGTASIFVIFITLSLVTFGVYAIVNVNMNRRLSDKSMNWNKMYYEIDADGQFMLFLIDEILTQAEINAINYISNTGYEQESFADIPIDLQSHINGLYNENTNLSEFIANTLNKIYFYEVLVLLNNDLENLYIDLMKEKDENWNPPDIHILPLSDGNIVSRIVVESIFHHEFDSDFHMSIKVGILPIIYDLEIKDNIILAERDLSLNRFEITEWRQWQTPIN